MILTRKHREAIERLHEVAEEIERHEPEIVDVQELEEHLGQPAYPLTVVPTDIAT